MKIFFLTKNQEQVFYATSHELTSIASIAKIANVPRTSAEKALKSLGKLGLVVERKVRDKNKHLYSRAKDDVLDSILTSTREKIISKKTVKTAGIFLSGETKISCFSGKKDILECLFSSVKKRKNERVYAVQGPNALTSWAEYIGEENVSELHSIIKSNSIIMTGLRSENLHNDIKKNKQLGSTMQGRLSQVHALQDLFLQENFFMYVFNDEVILINLQEKTALEIKDKIITLGLKKLISFLLLKTERDIKI